MRSAERPLSTYEWPDFARMMVTSRDLDPAYPVLEHLAATKFNDSPLQFLLVYLAHYDVPAAVEHMLDVRAGLHPKRVTATERRNLRTAASWERHFDSLRKLERRHGTLRDWLRRDFQGSPEDDWQHLRSAAEECWGNGRWASYKLAELCKEVLGWPVAAPDMGMEGASGPAAGLAMVYPGYANPYPGVVAMESLGRAFTDHLNAQIIARHDFADLATNGFGPLSLAHVETLLCDGHSLAAGGYYVGHDIDKMLGQCRHVGAKPATWVLQARKDCGAFAPESLGEHVGWNGIRKDRRRAWVDHGVLLDPVETWARG